MIHITNIFCMHLRTKNIISKRFYGTNNQQPIPILTLIEVLIQIIFIYIFVCSVSTQFRASPFERALFSALNRVWLKISFEN